jgi:hypothetical protein
VSSVFSSLTGNRASPSADRTNTVIVDRAAISGQEIERRGFVNGGSWDDEEEGITIPNRISDFKF